MESPYVLHSESNSGAVEFVDSPFRYFIAQRCLSRKLGKALLEWFESSAPWKLVETDFYEQYEFGMQDISLPDAVSPLTFPDNLSQLRRTMESLFNLFLCSRVLVVAHKLVPGQRIAIHNDYLGGDEALRLTIQLNRGLSDEDGGLFVLFNSFDPDDIHRIIRPIDGSCLGFEIGENSNHAVSKIYRGERYTLVYSFFTQSQFDAETGRN